MSKLSPQLANVLKWMGIGLFVFIGVMNVTELRVDNLLYAAISKQLLVAENPLILKVGTTTYLNKPPLFFWCTAIVFKVAGVSIPAAKAVSVAFGLGILVLVGRLASRLGGSETTGSWAMFALLITTPFVHLTDACRMESMLLFWMLLSLELYARYREHGSVGWMLASGASLGLAVMTKGAAGLLPLVIMVVDGIRDRKSISGLRFTAHLVLGVAAMLAVCGWWFAYIIAHTDFVNVHIKGQVLDRLWKSELVATDPSLPRETYIVDPWYRYLWSFLCSYFYLLPFAGIGAVILLKKARNDRWLILGLIFILLQVVFIHLLVTKYLRYLYPIYVLLAVPTAVGLERVFGWSSRRIQLTALVLAGCIFALWPTALYKRHYYLLQEARVVAQQNALPLVLSKGAAAQHNVMNACRFYLDEWQSEPPGQGAYLLVVDPKSTENEPGYTLLASRRVKVNLVPGNP